MLQWSDYQSKKASTVIEDPMVAVVAGCIITGKCRQKSALSRIRHTLIRHLTADAETKVAR